MGHPSTIIVLLKSFQRLHSGRFRERVMCSPRSARPAQTSIRSASFLTSGTHTRDVIRKQSTGFDSWLRSSELTAGSPTITPTLHVSRCTAPSAPATRMVSAGTDTIECEMVTCCFSDVAIEHSQDDFFVGHRTLRCWGRRCCGLVLGQNGLHLNLLSRSSPSGARSQSALHQRTGKRYAVRRSRAIAYIALAFGVMRRDQPDASRPYRMKSGVSK